MEKTLSGATTPDQSEPGGSGNEGAFAKTPKVKPHQNTS